MGIAGGKSQEDVSNWATIVDLGPQQVATGFEIGRAYSLESVKFPGSFVRHKDFELWVDKREEKVLYLKDASFTLERGLMGQGISLRSGNFPLYYVRHKDSKLVIDEYDGQELLRADSSFELRVHSSDQGAVCFCSTNFPGRYLYCDDENKVKLRSFLAPTPEPFMFRLVPALGIGKCRGIGRPIFKEVGGPQLKESFFVVTTPKGVASTRAGADGEETSRSPSPPMYPHREETSRSPSAPMHSDRDSPRASLGVPVLPQKESVRPQSAPITPDAEVQGQNLPEGSNHLLQGSAKSNSRDFSCDSAAEVVTPTKATDSLPTAPRGRREMDSSWSMCPPPAQVSKNGPTPTTMPRAQWSMCPPPASLETGSWSCSGGGASTKDDEEDEFEAVD